MASWLRSPAWPPPQYGPRGGSQGSACSNGPRSTASAASELAAASAARLTRRTRREGDPLVWAARFGELALLYNSPRAATVLCEENGVLWALERKAFRCDAGEMQGRCRGDAGEI